MKIVTVHISPGMTLGTTLSCASLTKWALRMVECQILIPKARFPLVRLNVVHKIWAPSFQKLNNRQNEVVSPLH